VSAAPDVSVVVIGRNEGERLVRCLQSIAALRLPGRRAELLYVDSASGDGSPERAAAAGARVLRLQPEHPTAALGRNAGWRAAAAPFVMFVDGDTVLHPDFVQRALDAMADGRVAAVAGLVSEVRPYCSVYTRVLDLDWWQPIGPVDFCGGNALMRRSVLAALGGFDETLIAGEEPELCGRIRAAGHLILHLDQPMVAHDLAVTRWSQYWKRAVRSGHAFAQVAERFRETDGFWHREARANVVHTSILLGLVAAGVGGSLLLRSPVPVLAVLAVLLALVLRTAWRARRKSPSTVTLLLYGVHAHLQQLPITVGQILFHRDRRRGQRRRLIEYKPWK